jgi:hypothetical protein
VERGFIPSCRSAARSLSRALHRCGDLLCVLVNSSRRYPGVRSPKVHLVVLTRPGNQSRRMSHNLVLKAAFAPITCM